MDETGSTTLVDAGEHDLKARQRMLLLVVTDCSNAEPGRKADDTVIKEGPQKSFWLIFTSIYLFYFHK